MESSSPSNLLDGYTKKENFMTTTVRGGVRGRVDEEQGGMEQEGPFEGISPLVLAALMARREEREGISPLLLATLMARRRGREEGEGIAHPLVVAALMSRRGERQQDAGVSPRLLGSLVTRRRPREAGDGIQHARSLA